MLNGSTQGVVDLFSSSAMLRFLDPAPILTGFLWMCVTATANYFFNKMLNTVCQMTSTRPPNPNQLTQYLPDTVVSFVLIQHVAEPACAD